MPQFFYFAPKPTVNNVNLLDGFEGAITGGISGTGLYENWTVTAFGSIPTLSRTTSHVTQGSFSWEVTGLVTDALGGVVQNATWDATVVNASPDAVKLDVFIQTLNANDYVTLLVQDSSSIVDFASTVLGQTGAHTLTLFPFNVTDYSDVQFGVIVGDITIGLHGSYDVFFDNLRAANYTLLEGFESISGGLPSGGPVWAAVTGGSYSQQGTFVTQGSFGGRLTGNASGTATLSYSNFTNLSAYSAFSVDVQNVTAAPGFFTRLAITDGTNTEFVDGTPNITVTETLTLVPTTVNLSSAKLQIITIGVSNSGYFDNLRAL